LVANPTFRLEGINAILERHYNLLTGVFLQCGLLDAKEEFHTVNLCSDASKMLINESARVVKMPADYKSVAEAAWNVCVGKDCGNLWREKFEVHFLAMYNQSLISLIPYIQQYLRFWTLLMRIQYISKSVHEVRQPRLQVRFGHAICTDDMKKTIAFALYGVQ